MQFIVTQENTKKRLDKFLSAKIQDLSRSQIQKLILNKNVLVNQKAVAPHYFLKEKDTVVVESRKSSKVESQKSSEVESRKLKVEDAIPEVQVIDQTPEYLIVNKPAGLIAHGAKHISKYSLADWLAENFPQIKNIGEDEYRPGIVHRLDEKASGLMAIALTQEAFLNLKSQFQKRTILKEYAALVHGSLDKEHGIIDFPIQRSSNGHKMAAIPKTGHERESQNPREALTEFWVEKKLINYTLLKARIKTGRTHQIRVHLAALGHPIAGDDLYGNNKIRLKNAKLKLNRIFLVSTKLGFKNLQGEKKEYRLKLPDELKKFLEKLK